MEKVGPSERSVKSRREWTCRSMCCASGRRIFDQIKPLKRAGDAATIAPTTSNGFDSVPTPPYEEGYTIKGVQKLFRQQGAQALVQNNLFERASTIALAARQEEAESGALLTAAEPIESAPQTEAAADFAVQPEDAPPVAPAGPVLTAQDMEALRASSSNCVRRCASSRRFARRSAKGGFLRIASGGPCAYKSAVGAWRSPVSALVWGTRGRGFESRRSDHFFSDPHRQSAASGDPEMRAYALNRLALRGPLPKRRLLSP